MSEPGSALSDPPRVLFAGGGSAPEPRPPAQPARLRRALFGAGRRTGVSD